MSAESQTEGQRTEPGEHLRFREDEYQLLFERNPLVPSQAAPAG